MAKQCWDVAKEPVVRAKQYDLAKKYVGNLVGEFIKVKAMYEYDTALLSERKETAGADLKAFNENHFIEDILRLIEVALALGDNKAAEEIQKKALEVVADQRLLDAIQTGKTENAQQENSPDEK